MSLPFARSPTDDGKLVLVMSRKPVEWLKEQFETRIRSVIIPSGQKRKAGGEGRAEFPIRSLHKIFVAE